MIVRHIFNKTHLVRLPICDRKGLLTDADPSGNIVRKRLISHSRLQLVGEFQTFFLENVAYFGAKDPFVIHVLSSDRIVMGTEESVASYLVN